MVRIQKEEVHSVELVPSLKMGLILPYRVPMETETDRLIVYYIFNP